ncbi:phosphatidylserine decarboxylase family protein [Roseivirga sp. BDSF3-8]|uniref:phosphatidylserine decarboxylase family protein n=1 Tax=Roseivirga sp. BDSF3-8 TaxID=3241598 RepID=UPI0035324FE0
MTIHKEGRSLLLAMFTLLLIINAVVYIYSSNETVEGLVTIGSIILYLLVLQFFRNPRITSPVNEKHVLAPADGKVVVIEEVEEPEYFKGRRLQISIFMSPVNVHVNRNPVAGVIKYFKYHAGKYLVAWHPKSSTDNERTTIVINTPSGVEVLMRQIAGAMARRIKWYIDEGDKVEQGQEFGFIKFGSRVDVLLPIDSKVTVNIGDKTKGGRTVLAELTS